MQFLAGHAAINSMGYSISKLEIDSGLLDGSSSNNEVKGSSQSKSSSDCLDHEIAQLTKLRSGPHENLSRVLPGKRELPVSTTKMLAGREANFSGRGRFSSGDCCHILSKYLPVNGPWVVDQMSTRAYVSQFSADGSLFVAAFQGSHIKIYDVDRGWKVRKNILARSLRWTVTDTSLSPNQQYLVYATMSPIVNIVNVGSTTTTSLANITEIHDGLDFSAADDGGYSFGIFSLKFSTDGREIVAGSSDDALYVYDLEANKLSLRIQAHTSDVNTVCFADEGGHLIYSGSDDNFCKVWDRRCFKVKGKPAGVLLGHLEGVTFLDSRGDGRYFISNGKDQAIKLWDIRKMSSNTNCQDPIKLVSEHSILRRMATKFSKEMEEESAITSDEEKQLEDRVNKLEAKMDVLQSEFEAGKSEIKKAMSIMMEKFDLMMRKMDGQERDRNEEMAEVGRVSVNWPNQEKRFVAEPERERREREPTENSPEPANSKATFSVNLTRTPRKSEISLKTNELGEATIARDSAVVFAGKGETLQEYGGCTERALNWGPGGGPDLIVDDGRDTGNVNGLRPVVKLEDLGFIMEVVQQEDCRISIRLAEIGMGLNRIKIKGPTTTYCVKNHHITPVLSPSYTNLLQSRKRLYHKWREKNKSGHHHTNKGEAEIRGMSDYNIGNPCSWRSNGLVEQEHIGAIRVSLDGYTLSWLHGKNARNWFYSWEQLWQRLLLRFHPT